MKEVKYIQVFPPNKEELARLLTQCKGDQRTMLAFSQDTKLSTSMLSRILNGNLTRPLSVQTLQTIFDCRDMDADVSLEQLYRANGFIPASEIADDQLTLADVALELEKEKSVREVLLLSLYRNGYGMMAAKSLSAVGGHTIVLPKAEIEKNSFSFSTDLAIAPIGYDGINMVVFNFCLKTSSTAGNPSKRISDESVKTAINDIMRDSSEFLLIDAWHPEKLEGIVHSWVFSDESLYSSFKDRMFDAKLNSSMTVILVDTDKREVVKEEWLHCAFHEGSKTPYNAEIV